MKKSEERIVTNLKLITKLLRGTAELLGDEMPGVRAEKEEESLGASSSVPMDQDAEDADDEMAGRSIHVHDTGRSAILATLPEETRVLLEELRYSVLLFLSEVDEALSTSSAPPTSSPTTASAAADGSLGASISSSSPSGSGSEGLHNSAGVRGAWLKLAKITLGRRMAWLKGIDNVKKWVAMNRRMTRPVFIKTIIRGLKIRAAGLPGVVATSTSALDAGVGPWVGDLSTVEYWKGHDVSSNTLTNLPWLLHAKRLQQLPYVAVKKCLQGPQRDVYNDVLQRIAKLCCHDYDAIRAKARSTALVRSLVAPPNATQCILFRSFST